jgi:hypothetical protein
VSVESIAGAGEGPQVAVPEVAFRALPGPVLVRDLRRDLLRPGAELADEASQLLGGELVEAPVEDQSGARNQVSNRVPVVGLDPAVGVVGAPRVLPEIDRLLDGGSGIGRLARDLIGRCEVDDALGCEHEVVLTLELGLHVGIDPRGELAPRCARAATPDQASVLLPACPLPQLGKPRSREPDPWMALCDTASSSGSPLPAASARRRRGGFPLGVVAATAWAECPDGDRGEQCCRGPTE